MATCTLELATMDLCVLQLACMDRITNLKALIQSAETRSDAGRAVRLKNQLARIEDLLARLVRL